MHVHDGVIRLTFLVEVPRACKGCTSRSVRSTSHCRCLIYNLTSPHVSLSYPLSLHHLLVRIRSRESSARGCDHDLQRSEEHEHVAARGEYHTHGRSVGLTRCSAGSAYGMKLSSAYFFVIVRFDSPVLPPHTLHPCFWNCCAPPDEEGAHVCLDRR